MLKPFVKWPGGKSEEINHIQPYCPRKMRKYVEPFLGGGAFFLSLPTHTYEQAYLNDFSKELIGLYTDIKQIDPIFYESLDQIWAFWKTSFSLFENHLNHFSIIYQTKDFQPSKIALKINRIIRLIKADLIEMKPKFLSPYLNDRNLIAYFQKAMLKKMITMKRNESKLGQLPESDYHVNFECGVKTAIYMIYRDLYNQLNRLYLAEQNGQNLPSALHIALFYYLREFCYSSMFRYNRKGDFNVPYGGITYNHKRFDDKIFYTKDQSLQDCLNQAHFYAEDFETFFDQLDLNEEDFIFLDPPYDSDFSCYANQSFDQSHQIRLANYLIHRCKARFMVVIKYTAFIESLYSGWDHIRIEGFDKDYRVSFKNRNDRKVQHLMILKG